MSKIDVKSPKHCAEKHTLVTVPRRRRVYLYLSTITLLLLSLLLLFWLILRPAKPHFSLQQADVNQLNLAGSSSSNSQLLNSSIQLTLQSTNPNNKLGIYYDEFRLYASYKSQKITPDTSISPFYQDHQETTFLSASLVGIQQPVSPSFAYEVQRDMATGKLVLSFKGNGRLRWKVGTWVSGRYRFMVDCVTVMPFGAIPSPPLSSRQATVCSTTV
ncbi:NDR1/HIN1-like protein 26 [Henckelia pumila]|uniref:NDR1/HIN1-like protein 26 n=1 Tax=Henckelia pumila TaxID=405737 RepID=UPI003C6E6424